MKIGYKLVMIFNENKCAISTPVHYFDYKCDAIAHINSMACKFTSSKICVINKISDNLYKIVSKFGNTVCDIVIAEIQYQECKKCGSIIDAIFRSRCDDVFYRGFNIKRLNAGYFYVIRNNIKYCFKWNIESCIDFIDNYHINNKI